MEQEFITLASADVMVDNITYQRAEALSGKLADIPGVSEVAFDDTSDHYRGAAALFSVTFDGEADDPGGRRRPSKRSGRYWRTMTPTSPPRWDGTPPPISSGRWASSS